MLQRLFIMITLALLAACEPNVKEETVVIDQPADVEDRTATNEQMSPDAEAADAENQVTTRGISDGSSMIKPLEDPESLLSSRIIYFAYDSNEISEEYRAIIAAHADYLLPRTDLYITLEGHADERGSREYNLALGERRARSIKRRLMLLGVSADQIRLVSYGEERPVDTDQTEVAWSKNRRVEIRY